MGKEYISPLVDICDNDSIMYDRITGYLLDTCRDKNGKVTHDIIALNAGLGEYIKIPRKKTKEYIKSGKIKLLNLKNTGKIEFSKREKVKNLKEIEKLFLKVGKAVRLLEYDIDYSGDGNILTMLLAGTKNVFVHYSAIAERTIVVIRDKYTIVSGITGHIRVSNYIDRAKSNEQFMEIINSHLRMHRVG